MSEEVDLGTRPAFFIVTIFISTDQKALEGEDRSSGENHEERFGNLYVG